MSKSGKWFSIRKCKRVFVAWTHFGYFLIKQQETLVFTLPPTLPSNIQVVKSIPYRSKRATIKHFGVVMWQICQKVFFSKSCFNLSLSFRTFRFDVVVVVDVIVVVVVGVVVVVRLSNQDHCRCRNWD